MQQSIDARDHAKSAQFFSDLHARLSTADEREALQTAFSLWLMYPFYLEIAGGLDTPSPAGAEWVKVKFELNRCHRAAAGLLMRFAERVGIDSGPIWKSMLICEDLFDADPQKASISGYITWPDCLGPGRRMLPDPEREAVLAGEATVRRLSAISDNIASELHRIEIQSNPAMPIVTAEKIDQRALACLIAHPDWTTTQIADAIGCHRSTLHRSEKYSTARALLKAGRDDLPRGSKDPDTGTVEAWEE